MIMRLISEPCSRMSEILSFRNWARSMLTCYTHILRGVRMYMPCVHRRKAIIPSATTFGGTVSAQKGKELRPNAKIVLQKLIKNSKAGLFCNTCKVSGRILLMLWVFKYLDPATESRRCHMYRFNTGGPIPDFHTIMDLTSHLGTHCESPYHPPNGMKSSRKRLQLISGMLKITSLPPFASIMISTVLMLTVLSLIAMRPHCFSRI